MILFVSIILLFVAGVSVETRAANNPFTNLLAIHLVADKIRSESLAVRPESLADGSESPFGLNLIAEPILSDADIMAWNVTNHTFVITPAAAMRVEAKCRSFNLPFVLMSSGEPIYLGVFTSSASSASAAAPVILTDSIIADCFMGITNVPSDVLRMVGRGDPGVLERLMALTNATTNVTLQIDAGYPAPDGLGRGVDRRDDKRVAAAVEKLFGKGNR